MSMIGTYLRISPSRLGNLLKDPTSLLNVLYPEDHDYPEDQLIDIDKAWHAIHFMLNGDPWEGEVPLVNVVLGGAEVSNEDIGYGPARYLNPQEVQLVAAAVSAIAAQDLLSKYDPEKFRLAEIYPEGWSDSSDNQQYISGHYTALVKFFKAAAHSGDAIILWLS